MIALFIVLTFTFFIVLDHILLRKAPRFAEDMAAAPAERLRALPPVVAGFRVPDNVRFHPGHTWAAAETAELVRVGVDDFAAKLVGAAKKVDTPARGQWIRQGQKIFSFQEGDRTIDMVSPIEGTVVEVNEAALNAPSMTREDPYGDGWLIEVHSPDAKTNFKNLMNGTLARRWMEEAAARLRALVPAPAGAFAQDGGVVSDDVLSLVLDWKSAVHEFFLTA
ncbi:MAG TPA: glycine cleavage system protein H [Thermoanaerobaculia bacterium]